jgi:hypothetical protein
VSVRFSGKRLIIPTNIRFQTFVGPPQHTHPPTLCHLALFSPHRLTYIHSVDAHKPRHTLCSTRWLLLLPPQALASNHFGFFKADALVRENVGPSRSCTFFDWSFCFKCQIYHRRLVLEISCRPLPQSSEKCVEAKSLTSPIKEHQANQELLQSLHWLNLWLCQPTRKCALSKLGWSAHLIILKVALTPSFIAACFASHVFAGPNHSMDKPLALAGLRRFYCSLLLKLCTL